MSNGSAGYSKTPLIRKVGIKPGMRVVFMSAPPEYQRFLDLLPEGVSVLKRPLSAVDFLQAFVTRRAQLRRSFPRWKRTIEKDGMIWICWPKKGSGLRSDLDGNRVRADGLETGLVDVKVCGLFSLSAWKTPPAGARLSRGHGAHGDQLHLPAESMLEELAWEDDE